MVFEDAAVASKYLIKTNYIFKVMAVHPETQTVDIVQDVLEFCNTPNGEFTINNEFGINVSAGIREPDVLLDIPILQLRWGQFAIQCCPKEGDTGVLAVFVNDIQNWMVNGGPSIPNTDEHFMKCNSVFIPFIPNYKNCAQDYPEDNNSLVIKSANAKIVLTDDGETSSVAIEADKMTMKGDLEVTGDVKASGDVQAGNVSLKDHTHTIPSGTSLVNPDTGMTTAPVTIPKPDDNTGA